MSTTILRSGLWLLVLVLALYVIHESYVDQSFAEMIPVTMLQHALVLSGLLVIVGVAMRVLEKGQGVSKNRCKICRTPIPSGGIYCRAHLRHVLDLEDRRTHSGTTRVPRSR